MEVEVLMVCLLLGALYYLYQQQENARKKRRSKKHGHHKASFLALIMLFSTTFAITCSQCNDNKCDKLTNVTCTFDNSKCFAFMNKGEWEGGCTNGDCQSTNVTGIYCIICNTDNCNEDFLPKGKSKFGKSTPALYIPTSVRTNTTQASMAPQTGGQANTTIGKNTPASSGVQHVEVFIPLAMAAIFTLF